MYNRCCQSQQFQAQQPCKCEPIVLPVREKVCNRYFCVEQPIICPMNTKIVNHYVPRPVYYPTYTQSEECACEGTSMPNGMPTGMSNGMPNCMPNGMPYQR